MTALSLSLCASLSGWRLSAAVRPAAASTTTKLNLHFNKIGNRRGDTMRLLHTQTQAKTKANKSQQRPKLPCKIGAIDRKVALIYFDGFFFIFGLKPLDLRADPCP